MSFFRKVKSVFSREDEGAQANADSAALRSMMMKGPSGGGPMIWPVHPDVQKEIQKGTHYNMKVIVRGMRRTGKSTIVSRLCGYAPPLEYTPSPEISAGTIYHQGRVDRNGRSGVKVELWDVVDEGFRRTTLSNNMSGVAVADARSIDVYRGCHLVAFVVDRTRRETLEYAVREASHVPPTTCILFVLNFYDSPKESHTISEREIDTECRGLRRTTTPVILASSTGRLPPECCSAAATWVSISATLGNGLDILRHALEIPNALLHVASLETEILSHYQFIEQHQAWLLAERARLHLLEKEKCTAVRRRLGDPYVQPSLEVNTCRECEDRDSSAFIPPEMAITVSTVTSSTTNPRPLTDTEEDANGIAKGFFDDCEGDNDSDSEADKERDRDEPTMGPLDDVATSMVSNSRTPMQLQQLAQLNMVKVSNPAPAASTKRETFPSPLEDIVTLQRFHYSHFATEEKDDTLDMDEDKELDDAFFAAGASVGSSMNSEHHDKENDASTVTSDVKENESSPPKVPPLESTVASHSVSGEMLPCASLQADVSALLRQMQSAMEEATVEVETHRSHYDRVKGGSQSQNEKKSKEKDRKGKKSSKTRKNKVHEGDVKSSTPTEAVYDDGSFDVIKE